MREADEGELGLSNASLRAGSGPLKLTLLSRQLGGEIFFNSVEARIRRNRTKSGLVDDTRE